MLAFNVRLRVFVAAIAGVLGVGRGVARLTRRIDATAVIEREAVILQLRRNPSLGGVTRVALCAEQTGVNLRIGMTRNTRLGRAFEFVVDVALRALRRGVFAVQGKRRLAVIEILQVARTVVTALAIVSVFLNMLSHERRILFAVTIHARL